MSKQIFPRYVTLVSRVYWGNAIVVKLVGQGPKYYHTRHVWRDQDTGKETERDAIAGCHKPWKSKKSDYILIEGKMWDLQAHLREIKNHHDTATRTHEYDRENAKRDAVVVWDRDHPYPRLPDLESAIDPVTPNRTGGRKCSP